MTQYKQRQPAVQQCRCVHRGRGSFSVLGGEIFQIKLYWDESMGLRWGRRCKDMVGWPLPTRGSGERRRALTPHQGIVLTQEINTLTQLSRALAKPKITQKSRASLSTSQSDRLADQSTFGAGCLNRPVDDRLFGLTVDF